MSDVVLKYVGLADAQHFTKEDFTRHGVEDQGAVKFDHRNDKTNTVSAAAADLLTGDKIGTADSFTRVESSEPVTSEPDAAPEADAKTDEKVTKRAR